MIDSLVEDIQVMINSLVEDRQVGHVLFLFELGRVAFQNFSLGQRHGLNGTKETVAL